MNDLILKDKVVVISGGTKGVGRAAAIECSRQGARVVFGGRDPAAAEDILRQISNQGGEGRFVHTDLRRVRDCERLFEEAVGDFSRVDGFISYAGVASAAPLIECEEQLFDEVFETNIRAAFFCAKSAVRCMLKSGGGSIIMMGSLHAWRGEKDRAAYACSKGALVTLSEHIAHHYASNHIRCNLVTMGWSPTEGELRFRASMGIKPDQLRTMANGIISMGRMQEAEDYLPGIIYLLSDASSMVTGSNLKVSGGLSL